MNKSLLVSLVVVVVLTSWMLSGQISATRSDVDADPDVQAEKSASKVMRVRVKKLQPEVVTREVVIQGQVAPLQSVFVVAETAGVVAKIIAKKGQRVNTGDLLIELRMDDRNARLLEARALLKLRQIEHEAVVKLHKEGIQTNTELAVAESQLETAKAVLQQIQLDIQHTRLRAPFAGVINDQLVEPGDFLDRGNPAMLLVNDSQLLAVGNVPQQSIQSVQTGLTAKVKLLTGQELLGRISFVSATAETSTRSFRIEVAIENKSHKIISGLSGEIHIPVEQVSAHFLSPAMLTLNDEGELGVKTVDSTGHVLFHAVSIIKTTPKGAWVSGLPGQVRVITLGQGFVRAGDIVDAVSETVEEDTVNKQSFLLLPDKTDLAGSAALQAGLLV